MILNIILEYKWVILFYSSIVLLVYLNRKRLKNEAPFVYLYKTKFGISLMKFFAEKFNKAVKIFGYISIFLSYIGLLFISFMLIKNSYDLIISKPNAVGGSPVIPGLPIAGLGITFPLVIGWISLFIIMIVHEFSHGIVAKAHNVKIKTTGIAFFGPILGAFVEPDEKNLKKQSDKVQLSIFSAGPISNVFLWIVCIVLMFGLGSIISNITYADGVKIGIINNETLPAYSAGIKHGSIIIEIDNEKIRNLSDLENSLNDLKPEQEIFLKIRENETIKEIKLKTAKNPKNETKAYLGILLLNEEKKLKNNSFINNLFYKILLWFYELFSWTGFISINIGLINLFPIF
ncbi:MAG: site-2 protease family protein, partial [Candidatus Woesearchaeota archaeon]